MARVFLTGATGYVGGDTLYAIANALNDDREAIISCLARDDEKASAIIRDFGDRVRIVKASLDDSRVIEEECRNSDVVFNLASTKHIGCAKAIAAGLGDKSRSRPGYWIQMGGASMFVGDEVKKGQYGEPPSTTYDDVEDQERILSVIKANPAREVDSFLLAQDPALVRTALIVGPIIYGRGRGPLNQRSIQIPDIARVSLEMGQGFRLNKGQNSWSDVHVHDVSDVLSRLLQSALKGETAGWNSDGVYLLENGAMTFGDLCQSVIREAYKQGFVRSDRVDCVIDADKANDLVAGGALLWGTNAVLKSSKARQRLGWNPRGPSLTATLPDLVAFEAERLGMRKVSEQ